MAKFRKISKGRLSLSKFRSPKIKHLEEIECSPGQLDRKQREFKFIDGTKAEEKEFNELKDLYEGFTPQGDQMILEDVNPPEKPAKAPKPKKEDPAAEKVEEAEPPKEKEGTGTGKFYSEHKGGGYWVIRNVETDEVLADGLRKKTQGDVKGVDDLLKELNA